jgi:AcrR family transcriptional regulator
MIRASHRPDGTPVRVTKRRPETRARLLEAATTVFAERGFGQVSIEQITAAAGFTRGAFYSNFDSVEELFFALYEERAAVVAAQVAQALTTPSETVATLVDQVLAAMPVDRQWILIKTEFLLHAARNPRIAEVLAGHRDALGDILTAHFAAAVETGALPPALMNPEGLARAVITIHDGAMLQLLIDPDEQSRRRWLHDLLIALLDPRPGEPTAP